MLLAYVPVVGMLVVAFIIYWFLIIRRQGEFTGLLMSEISGYDVILLFPALAISLAILMAFTKLVPMKYMYDENVRILTDSFSLRFLALYFVPNAFYEELIFRGALQPVIGLLPAAILFTVVHVSYWKRPVMMLEVLLQALVLGVLYEVTGSLWITTAVHMAYNTIETWMIKSGRIDYRA